MNITYEYSDTIESVFTLNAILDIIVEGIWDWNAITGHVDRSPGWYKMLDYEMGAFQKDVFTWENIIHPDDYKKVMKHFELYTTGQIDTYKIEYRCKKADGSYLWIIDRGKAVQRDENGNLIRMIGAHQNIHKEKILQSDLLNKNQLLHEGNLTLEAILKVKNRELEEKNKLLKEKIEEVELLSITDKLTNTYNKRKYDIEIEKECLRAKRYQHPLSLILIDIDYFKHVNDKYGHSIGDVVLRKLSAIIKNELRSNDIIARWGGEEFIVILPDTNIDKAVVVAEKMKKTISTVELAKDVFITCSFGVAKYKQEDTAESLFIKADNALYVAKEKGRNQVQIAN